MPNVKSHGLWRGTLRDTQKTRACNFNAWRCICMSVFDGCGSGLTICLWHKMYLCCTPHELVCVRFEPFCLSCDGDWFCFLSLDCHDCARIRMCGEQLMLSATMKIVRLSSYRRLCRTADENLFRNSSARETKKQ